MKMWDKVGIKELCDITSSKRIYAADYQSEGVPFYRGKEIIEKQKGNLEVTTELFISYNKFDEVEKKYGAPQPGDLLLTSVGTLGIPYVVKENEVFYFKDGNLTWFKDFNNLDSQFLYYWLLSPQGKAELKKCTIGSSQSAFTIQLLKTMKIELPDLLTQSRIVDMLSAYDDLIDNNNRRIALLEEAIHRLYREWFVHLRFPGHEHTPIVAGVPEGWEKRPLSDLVSTQYGYTESAQDEPVGPKYLRGTDINKTSYIDWSTVPYCPIDDDVLPKFKLDKYDILMIRMADPGKVGIVEKEIEAVFASYLVRLKPTSDELTPYYLFYFLSSHEYQGFITGASTGATRKSASATLMTSVNIMVPSHTIQQSFADYVVPMRQQITNLLNQNEKLREARDALLPRLMNGSLPV